MSVNYLQNTNSMVNTVLRSHIFSNNIQPFEQLGTMEKTLGAKEAIIFDRVINREVRMYKRILYIGRTDVRKTYDSVFQEFITEMLNLTKVPKWTISWLKEAMRTWRTIQQVMESKEFKLSREIETDCGIFQGDSLSPTLFCIAFMTVIYCEKFKTGICTTTTIK